MQTMTFMSTMGAMGITGIMAGMGRTRNGARKRASFFRSGSV